jgi:hypothetical protein
VGIASNRAAEAYQKAISDYLQRKSDYTNNSISFQGEQALYKAGVISRESYFSAKSTYENSVLSFYQSKFALEKILEQMKIDPASILALNEGSAIIKSKIYAHSGDFSDGWRGSFSRGG